MSKTRLPSFAARCVAAALQVLLAGVHAQTGKLSNILMIFGDDIGCSKVSSWAGRW